MVMITPRLPVQSAHGPLWAVASLKKKQKKTHRKGLWDQITQVTEADAANLEQIIMNFTV